MRSFPWPVLAGVAVGAVIALLLQPPAAPSPPASYAAAVVRAAPAVVNIYSTRSVPIEGSPLCRHPGFADLCERYAPRRAQLSLGSGVIVDPEGLILTNEHIIRDATEISVALRDGRRGTATLVGTDRDTDLAVLQVELPELEPIAFADSDRARIGDVVLAIGNPFNLGQTVSQGILSATGRHGLGSGPYEDFLQTDAAINPGNSGGALVTADGRLLGINSLIFSRTGTSTGIGLAIPANLAMEVVHEIVRNGRVIRGWLGIEVQPLSDARAQELGVDRGSGLLVLSVQPGGPADRAGLQRGDLLLSIANRPAVDRRAVQELVAGTDPGDLVPLGVLRAGEPKLLQAVAGARPTG